MSSANLPLIILENPLIFMDGKYLKSHLLKGKYSKGEIIEIIYNQVPIKMIIKFEEESLIDEFLSQYNNKGFNDKLNYNFKNKKENLKLSENNIKNLLNKENENISFFDKSDNNNNSFPKENDKLLNISDLYENRLKPQVIEVNIFNKK